MLSLCFFLLTAADPPAEPPKGPPAADVLAAALTKAKADDKDVFLSFGSPGCVWCKYLDKYHDRPAVEKLLGKHVVFVKVDTVANPGGEDLYKKYAPKPGGVPVWVVLSADGAVLADSFEGEKGNVGFPYQPHEVAHYEKAIRKAVPKLADADVAALLAELKDAGPKKEDTEKK
jgi:uncharacterized protein YyaL (SSP411 family)